MSDEWEPIKTDRRQKLEQLLLLSKCPDEQCDGDGTCSRWPVPGYDGEADIDIWQCQWCDERKQVLKIGS